MTSRFAIDHLRTGQPFGVRSIIMASALRGGYNLKDAQKMGSISAQTFTSTTCLSSAPSLNWRSGPLGRRDAPQGGRELVHTDC